MKEENLRTKNRYQFYFLKSLGTLPEKKQFIEFNSDSCAIPRVDECHFNIANYVSCVLGINDKGRNKEKELGNFIKDLPILKTKWELIISYVVSFHDFHVGANMVQAIQDWLISKSAFEEGSFYNFASFNKKFIKDLSTIASLLVLEKSTPTVDGNIAPRVAGRLWEGNGLEANTLRRLVQLILGLLICVGVLRP
ncbi:hypothetical protein M9H77_31130 [Catharanthus roseus]|uniref:Uncharacterized protein n=1 Tax=Catharanthus roseus TaxID=4058 RepID=A0ACC0A1J3_CATRO|nr:hypothetical protein M9H77_31130 [Catharanthus roseus]